MNKKIAYIISDINKAVFFEQTAMALKEAGFELSFILINSADGSLDKFLVANGFLVKYLTVKKISKSLPAVIKCRHYLKMINPYIIHCHLGTANTIGLLAGFAAGIKMRIYTRHSGLPLEYSVKERLLNTIHNRMATHIIAISQNTKDILIHQHVPEKKISIVHHGFDLYRMMHPNNEEVLRIRNSYNSENQYPVIGVVARWLEWKGIQYIIPAFKKLLLQYPNARLCLFNASKTTGYGKQIDALLNELPPENYISVAFEKNVYDLYRLFDIYVHVPVNPSCEAFGQTYVEALAAGIPGIFTLSGVGREFIKDRENALVVDFQNSEAIYKSILELLNNNDIKRTITANGINDVQQLFSMERYIQQLKDVYTGHLSFI